MAYIRFNFGSDRTDISSKIANELEEKIDNLLSKFSMNYNDFFSQILNHVIGFYISSSNMSREPEKKVNENGRISIKLSNFFFRLELDSYAYNLLAGNTIMLKGNLIFMENENYNFLDIKDFYITNNNCNKEQIYERYVSGQVDYKNKSKSDFSYNNGILTLDLIKSIPLIVDKITFNNFVSNWRSYLEFEKSVTINNIKYFPVSGEVKYTSVSEVNDNASNRETFEKNILQEGNGNLYIDSTNANLSGQESPYILLTIKVKKEHFDKINFDEKKIKQFARQPLHIIGKKDKDNLDAMLEELKKSDEERKQSSKDLPEIKGFEIDENLQPKISNNEVIFYFLVADEKSYKKDADVEEEIKRMGNELYIAFIASGDIALYTRGKSALDKLESGDVKNPYLAGILIEPQKFENGIEFYNESNVEFALKKLNLSQRQAIIKCLNSNSIFCLQGPPGTGKTQTITELVYQYNKMGKKVLLSSQTHIAIDNVIERLPKELNILPLRLVRDRSKANAQYLPEKLLDNLYDAAYNKYKGKIDDYNAYEKNINELMRTFEANKARFENIERRLEAVKKAEKELNYLTQQLSKLRSDENTLDFEIKGVKSQLNVFSEYFRTKLPFEAVLPEFVYEPIISQLNAFAEKHKVEPQDDFYNYAIAFKRIAGKSRVEHLKKLSEGKEKPKELLELENEIEKLRDAINTNIKYGSTPDNLRSELNKKLQKKKELDRQIENSSTPILNINNEKFHFASNQITNPKERIEKELQGIESFVKEWNDILQITFSQSDFDRLNDKKDELETKLSKIENEIRRVGTSSANTKQSIEDMNAPIKTEREKLEAYFNEFYLNKLNGASLPETEKEKFDEIEKYIDAEKLKFQQFKNDFMKLQPIYESLSNYLDKREEFIKAQRGRFTKTLLKNNANVYGITCTSSPYFRSSTMIGAGNNYNIEKKIIENIELEDVDIRKLDFDVVIIDEVSKATPIEMLIPIIYRKSVILVGDQRQLPPIFKYRESMFDGFDEQSKNKMLQGKTLNEYKNMVEHSLFEEIYNKLKHNKAMLTQQYRFNEDIMNCVNVFYDNKLQLGAGKEQNNKRRHYLDVSVPNIKGGQTPIFVRNNNTYWFDSHLWNDGTIAYSEVKEGETSYRNPLEVKITVELLLLIEKGYGELKKNSPEEYKMAAGNGQKPSVAVISMYGKHISSIIQELQLRKMNKGTFQNIILDISTVDNYQGKEQDIVILNMVANSRGGNLSEFLKKFNRINVAISRARNMLIMVGSSNYYNGVSINVPRMDDGKENHINAYYRIYEKCQSIWQPASDVLNIRKEILKEITDKSMVKKSNSNQEQFRESNIGNNVNISTRESDKIDASTPQLTKEPIPIKEALESFHKCKKTNEGWVSPKDYFNQLQNDIKNFNADAFREFYKNGIYFEIIQVDRNTKFLKLKDNWM